MGRQLAFVTEGAIDIRSFTTFGINAKPKTESPIGYFGTGLKYAVAVLCRMGSRVRVFIDGEEYEFYHSDTEFRGKTFQAVRMRRRRGIMSRWRYESLPFTTELGKNWEPWQVFRELESNTRDEDGHTFLTDDEWIREHLDSAAMRGKTIILVAQSEVIEAFENRDKIFLPRDSLHKRLENVGVEVFNHPSRHLYFRGLRVADLAKPATFTYNFVAHMDLTEDRTLKYGFLARDRIMQAIARCDDEDFIRQVLTSDEEKSFEGELEFDNFYDSASPAFLEVVKRAKARGTRILPRATAYYDRYYVAEKFDPDVTVTLPRSEWDKISEVLEKVDLYEMATELGWEEEDSRFDPFIKLREKLKGDRDGSVSESF